MEKRILITACIALLVVRATAASITWKSDNPVLVKDGAQYGRIHRLDASTLIACYTWQRGAHVSLSHDEGKTWDAPIQVAKHADGNLANTELAVLRSGEVLCFFNFRPRGQSGKPYAIGMSVSTDHGKTWSPPKNLYTAAKDFGDGCWEPACVELPDGELQVYFANENPYRKSNEQEISLLRSRDRGRTWREAERVSFRKGHRDGMPVPVVAPDQGRIFVAIEDNGLSGAFKPVIVSTRLERGGWRDGAVEANSPNRWGALAKPLPAGNYAGAPYLRRFPNGPFVLSFQLAESGDMKQSRMAVCLGNEHARGFGDPGFPFPDSSGGAQLWNALFIKDAKTVTAISETSIKGVRGVWAVDGVLTP